MCCVRTRSECEASSQNLTRKTSHMLNIPYNFLNRFELISKMTCGASQSAEIRRLVEKSHVCRLEIPPSIGDSHHPRKVKHADHYTTLPSRSTMEKHTEQDTEHDNSYTTNLVDRYSGSLGDHLERQLPVCCRSLECHLRSKPMFSLHKMKYHMCTVSPYVRVQCLNKLRCLLGLGQRGRKGWKNGRTNTTHTKT